MTDKRMKKILNEWILKEEEDFDPGKTQPGGTVPGGHQDREVYGYKPKASAFRVKYGSRLFEMLGMYVGRITEMTRSGDGEQSLQYLVELSKTLAEMHEAYKRER